MKTGLLFQATKMNWDLYARGTGEWLKTEWKVYRSRKVLCEVLYDAMESWEFEEEETAFAIAQPQRTIRHTHRMRRGDYQKLKEMLADSFPQCETSSADDGEGWELVSYDTDGITVLHKKLGYIYGIAPLEELVALLETGTSPL
ncbi:MAG: hypothetical protein IJ461_01630 [Clostridia bacterium]|nr:hypothetical protein [Clostridia bacterium]